MSSADTSYYSHVRSDILTHVPSDVRRVLSVGCGNGCTEAKLIQRGVEVIGIEMSYTAAERARENGLTVLQGDAVQITRDLHDRQFDCLIYADVLEHLVDPQELLIRNLRLLIPHGTVIVSVPNFRHYRILWELFVRGQIQYTDAGILDRTHVRLTTRRLVDAWFRAAGIRAETVRYIFPLRRERLIAACSFGFAAEFLARQVILVGRRVQDASGGCPPRPIVL